jgi:hypothetical protein
MAKKKAKSLPDKCEKCGRAQATVWMKDGRPVAVEPNYIDIIFCNMAMADGRKLGGYVPHRCEVK